MSRRHCRSARREARPSNLCPLEPRGKHHGCQNAPISYIPHEIPMCENVMLSDVASSLSQHPSRIATKQLRDLEQRAAPDCQNAPPRCHIFPCSTIFANCHSLPAVLRKMYEPMLSGEHMSGLYFGSQLSLCPGGTYTLPADRACDCFAIYTRYAQYFVFSPPTCFGSPAQ